MGRTPSLLANYVEAHGHRTQVASNELVSSGLRRLVLRSPDFVGATIEPCDVTAVRVSRTAFRHYTPAVIDGDELTIVVQHHVPAAGESTPGQDLIAGWVPGEEVVWCRWSSARAFTWKAAGERPVVLFGDATVISLAMAMAERAAVEDRQLLAVLEVPPADVEAARVLVPEAVVVPAEPEPGVALDRWIGANAEALRAVPGAYAYLAGHGQSVQRQRAALRELVGLDRRSVRTQPFWATGKAGL